MSNYQGDPGGLHPNAIPIVPVPGLPSVNAEPLPKPLLPGWATAIMGLLAAMLPGLAPSVPYPWGWVLAVVSVALGLLAGVSSRVPSWVQGRPIVRGGFSVVAGGALTSLAPLYASATDPTEQGFILLAAAVLAGLAGVPLPQPMRR